MLHLYDTMTRAKVTLQPRVADRVSMYVCGPTVYDLPHLGHGRTALTYDILRRYLRWSGYAVTMVSNITDIDDNIINRATREGRTEPEVASEFRDIYIEQLDRLGIEHPDERPQATEFIDGMIDTIAELIDVGAAYVVEGRGVYFDVTKAPDYGKLAGRNLDQLLEDAGQRVEVDENKRSPLDFALWKSAKEGEPTWDTPWGPGRPGWHTECVAMSMSILGDDFDIHGGGDDLTFPHHQNEQAQAAAAGHDFARLWMHSAMLNVSGEKMSKSLNNFTTLADALDAHDPRAMRLAVLQTHYRSTMELGPAALASSAEAIDRLDAMVRRVRSKAEVSPADETTSRDELDTAVVERFVEAMDDDMATPSAVDAIFSATRRANTSLDDGDVDLAVCLARTVMSLAAVLGLEVGSEDADVEDDAMALARERDDARASKDFARADEIRDELVGRGYQVMDTADGTVIHR